MQCVQMPKHMLQRANFWGYVSLSYSGRVKDSFFFIQWMVCLVISKLFVACDFQEESRNFIATVMKNPFSAVCIFYCFEPSQPQNVDLEGST